MTISSPAHRHAGCWKDFLARAGSGLRVDHIITDPPYDADYEFLTRYFRDYACPTGSIILFSSPENHPLSADEYQFWLKPESTKNFSRRCGRFVEMISVFRGKDAPFNVLHWSQMTGVHRDRLIEKPTHPYQKPLTLIERLVRIYTNPGQLVFDPFAGSHTGEKACLNLGRRCISCEIAS
jgi:DNA modification methylase